jgi:hypothetical protein
VTAETYADWVLRYVCAVIAHPHTTITEHDRHRALELITHLFSDEDVRQHVYSQMNQEDFKQVKNIREHARNTIK